MSPTRVAACLFLLLFSTVGSARPLAEQPAGQLPIDPTGATDYVKLERVRVNAGYSGTTAELAQQLVLEPDLAIDRTSEVLYFKCKGLIIQPGSALAAVATEAAAQAAALDAAVAAGTSPLIDPAAAVAVGTDPAAAAAAAAMTADPTAAAAAGVADPVAVAAAAYLSLTQTGAEAWPAESEAVNAADGSGHHHHHHHHRRRLTALLNTDELPSPWKPNMPDPSSITETAAFTLHSRPSSTRKIYLDFNGHTTTGSPWNTEFGVATIVTPRYDKNSNPNDWSASELLDVFAIWRGVSEDFAAFDVDVTTEEPTAAVLAASGIRVCIGGSSSWIPGGAGGIAYLNSFAGNAQYHPAFVFPADLGPYYAKYIWMAASHEIGHTMGLYHDGGPSGQEYYQAATDWGPIMGAPYYSKFVQWSKGEYAGATRTEDDIQVITGKLTAALDVHGNSMAAATTLTGETTAGVTTAQVAGVIRAASDSDWLKFDAGPGVVTVQVLCTPAWGSVIRATLNMQVDLLNSAQLVLATRTGVGISSFTYTIATPGTYYLSIKGASSATTTPGYTTYGSIGQYQALLSYFPTTTCATAPAQNPANGAFSCSTTSKPGDVCVAACSSGFAGSPYVTCQQDGNWSPMIVGECVRVCNGNPTLGNGTFSCAANSPVGRVCNGTCLAGYLGSPRVVCQDDSTWSTVEGSCQRACTTQPTNPTSGTFSSACRPTLVGGTCTATCSTGFTAGSTGAPTTTCLATGAWSASTGTCVRVCATNLTTVATNANPFSCSATSLVNDKCVATCKDGFLGSPTVTCTSTGAWSAITGSCIAVCRTAPTNPLNGVFSCPTNITAGKTCTAQCNFGYRGTPTVTCSTTGTWSATTGTCTPVCAVQPPAVANATFACPITALNTRCSATCIGNFKAGTTGLPSYLCSASNTWASPTGSCVPVTCSTQPANPTGAVYSCPAALVGGTCTATCSASFIAGPTGAPTTTCLATGAWSASTGTCVRVCAKNPTTVATNANPFSCSATSLVNDKCVATCKDSFLGSPTVTCTSTGAWSAITGSCVAVCRTAPTNPLNGVFSCPTNITAGKTCTAQCNFGYRGTPTVTCSTTGTWSAMTGTCTPVCAIQPPAVANAAFACPITAVNTRCSAVCVRNFKAGTTGLPSYLCSASNTWASPTGSCVPVLCTTAPPALTRAAWPSNCTNTVVGTVCTATCSPTKVIPAIATCTLGSTGTSASWVVSGTC